MFERNPDTIETNGSREWDQRNGYVHSLMNTANIENSDFKSEIFKRPCFRYFPIVNIENSDFKKSEIFKRPCFRYLPTANIENSDFKKSEVFKHPCFRYSPIVNIENSHFKNPRFSNIRLFYIHL